jgi:hypothetical protein
MLIPGLTRLFPPTQEAEAQLKEQRVWQNTLLKLPSQVTNVQDQRQAKANHRIPHKPHKRRLPTPLARSC